MSHEQMVQTGLDLFVVSSWHVVEFEHNHNNTSRVQFYERVSGDDESGKYIICCCESHDMEFCDADSKFNKCRFAVM
jgi:hypothetical protein